MYPTMLEICGTALFVVVAAFLWWLHNAKESLDDRRLPVFSCFSFASEPDLQDQLMKEMVKVEKLLSSLAPELVVRRLNLSRAHVTTSYVGMPVWACERDIGVYAEWLKGVSSTTEFDVCFLPTKTMKFRKLAVLDQTLVLIADDDLGMLKSLNKRLRDVNTELVVPDRHRAYIPHVSLFSVRGLSPELVSEVTELVATYQSDFEVPYDFFFSVDEGAYTPTINWRIRKGAPCPGDITPD